MTGMMYDLGDLVYYKKKIQINGKNLVRSLEKRSKF